MRGGIFKPGECYWKLFYGTIKYGCRGRFVTLFFVEDGRVRGRELDERS